MIELSKTDAKHLAIVEPYLDTIQEFIEEHIKDGNAMTAAAIHEKYRAEYETDEDIADEQVFVKGFRVAVRVGAITGIESAKRLGYRRIGDTIKTKNAADVAMEAIGPHLGDLQAFIDLHIQGETKMTASAIYEKFKAECTGELPDEDTFVSGLRAAISQGKITGLATAYRYGYQRAKEGSSDEDTSAPVGAEIRLGESVKIVRLDKYNWVIMEHTGESWSRKGNYGSTPWSALHMAQSLLKMETERNLPYDAKELLKTVEEAHKHIAELLKEALMLAKKGAFASEEEQDAA